MSFLLFLLFLFNLSPKSIHSPIALTGLLVDPECDIAVATLAQLLLQQGKVAQALKYFERAGELARTEAEVVNAVSYAEATRAQLDVQEKYPKLATRLAQMGGPGFAGSGL
jgi:import receptor subunit TOM70